MKLSAIISRSKYSAISFAAIALAFSMTGVAAPAEVSGSYHQPTINASTSTSTAIAPGYKGYLSFNQYANVPSTTVYAPQPRPVAQDTASRSAGGYDSELLDSLQATVTAELDALIELQGL